MRDASLQLVVRLFPFGIPRPCGFGLIIASDQ